MTEDTKVTAARELEEETGYRAEKSTFLISIRTTVAFCDERIDIYVAENLSKTEQHLDEDEYVEILEFSLEELLEMIQNGTIQDAKTISALLAYATYIKK